MRSVSTSASLRVGLLALGGSRSGIRRYGRMIAGEIGEGGAEILSHETDLSPGGWAGIRESWRAVRRLRSADVSMIPYGPYRLWAPGGWKLAQLAIVYLGLRRRTVTTVHDAFFPESCRRVEWWALVTSMTLSSVVVVHGTHEQRRLAAIPGGRRAVVIPLFIEERPLSSRSDARRQLDLRADTPVLAMIGWIHPRKNCELAIEVLARLGADARLWLVGTAPEGENSYLDGLLALARKQRVADRVYQTGFVSEAELNLRLAALDVGLCPYHDISASASVSTLLAARRPLVSSDLPFLRDIQRAAPDVVTIARGPGPDAFVEAITEVLDAPPPAGSFDALLGQRSLPTVARAYRELLHQAARRG